MSRMPLPIIVFFLLTALATLWAFAKAVRGSRTIVAGSIVWMCVQSIIALSGFYLITNTLPPHLTAAAAPPLILIAGLLLTGAGKCFLDRMDLQWCVLLHTVRILVELNLYWLFLFKQVPVQMTF